MPTLLNFTQPDKAHWLTQPRYAVITWPLLLTPVTSMAGFGGVAIALFGIAVSGYARLTWFKLLPHEQGRLDQARKALHATSPAQAINALQEARWVGTHYQVKRVALLARAYCQQDDYSTAHQVLNALADKPLLPDEQLCLNIAWAQLFNAADNPAEARRRLAGIADQQCLEHLDCLLLKADLALQHEDYQQARALLDAGLDRYQQPSERVLLHNNLARTEGLRGHTDIQLRHLKAALVEFKRAPRADLTDIVHHNLAIALVKNGQPSQAKEVLRNAQAASTDNGLAGMITLLNNQLLVAREAGDSHWIQQVHAEFDRQSSLIETASPGEQLALTLSRLSMMRNDAINRDSSSYPDLVKELLDKLSTSSPSITVAKRIAGLVVLRNDIQQELATHSKQANQETEQLIALLKTATQQLQRHSATIDTYLTNLSPKLFGPLLLWHRYRTDADKARIQLANDPSSLQHAFTTLFNHLREKAEWLSEQGTAQQSIEAWLIICDEIVAYHDELQPEVQQRWQQEYAKLALQALDQATALMNKLQHHRQHIDQLIGLAYFSLRLRNDKAAAARWMEIVHSYSPVLGHYAQWLKRYYGFVCGVLATNQRGLLT